MIGSGTARMTMIVKLAICGVALVAGILMATSARAEFLIGSGDTLAISVLRVPELNRRAVVDPDGNIAFPQLGVVKAAGLGLAEFRAGLTHLLASKDIVRQPDVLVELVGMRPITVNGDVSKPGEYAFHATLTVRQAVATAGGYDLLRFRATNPPLELPDARAEHQAVALDLARQLVRNALNQAELDGQPKPVLPEPDQVAVPASVLAQIVAQERREISARAQRRDGEKQAVARLVVHSDEQIAALQDQHREDENNVQQLNAEVAQIRSLLERGLSNMVRMQDAQQTISLSRSRVSEGIASIALAWRGREELTRQLGRIDEDYRLTLMQAVSDGVLQARKLRARQDASEERLLYIGALRSYLRQRAGHDAEFVVWRWDGTRQVRVDADEGTPLQPGDAVEVALRGEGDAANTADASPR